MELLLELDLPARASALLGEAAGRASAGAGDERRAEIGTRLAALRLAENDPAGAQSALDATDSPELPEALRARRTTLAAAIAERRGGPAAARPGTGAAEATSAAGAEAALGRRDWAAAAQALGRNLDARLPAAPATLGREQREAALRLAAALVLAGDDAALAALRERVADRMRDGPHADAFARLVGARALPGVAAAR